MRITILIPSTKNSIFELLLYRKGIFYFNASVKTASWPNDRGFVYINLSLFINIIKLKIILIWVSYEEFIFIDIIYFYLISPTW